MKSQKKENKYLKIEVENACISLCHGPSMIRDTVRNSSAVRYDEKVLTTVITLGSPPAQPAISSSHTGRQPWCGAGVEVWPGKLSPAWLQWRLPPHFLPGHNLGDSVSSVRDCVR